MFITENWEIIKYTKKYKTKYIFYLTKETILKLIFDMTLYLDSILINSWESTVLILPLCRLHVKFLTVNWHWGHASHAKNLVSLFPASPSFNLSLTIRLIQFNITELTRFWEPVLDTQRWIWYCSLCLKCSQSRQDRPKRRLWCYTCSKKKHKQ